MQATRGKQNLQSKTAILKMKTKGEDTAATQKAVKVNSFPKIRRTPIKPTTKKSKKDEHEELSDDELVNEDQSEDEGCGTSAISFRAIK